MKSLGNRISNWFSLRSIDKALSGGLFKQLIYLVGALFLLLLILYFIVITSGIKNSELVRVENDCQSDSIEVGGKKVEAVTENSVLWTVYYHFVDPGNQHMVVSTRGRFFSMLITTCGSIFFGGLLISTICNILSRRVERQQNGLLRYRFNNHVVILGFDEMVPCLIRQLCEREEYDNSLIVMQSSNDIQIVRMRLLSELLPAQYKRVIFVYSRRDMKNELLRLRVHKAKEVYILGENHIENDVEFAHDSINMNCMNLIGDICIEKKRKNKLKCFVLFEYQTTYSLFQFSDIRKDLKSILEFEPFNSYETWAQKVLVMGRSNEGVTYQHIDREPITYESEKTIHFVIIGMTKMGTALAQEVAHIAHFPNFIRDKNKKTKITFIDPNARQEMNFFMGRHRNLFDMSYSTFIELDNKGLGTDDSPCDFYQAERHKPNDKYAHLLDVEEFIDIEWEFIQSDVASPKLEQLMTKWVNEENSILTIAVCTDYPHESLATSIYLPTVVYDKHIPIWVLQYDSSAILKNVKENSRYCELRPFGMYGDCFDFSLANNDLAQRVKYVYSYFYNCSVSPKSFPSKKELYKLWNDGEDVAKRWSNVFNANTIEIKLRSIGYSKEKWNDITTLNEQELELLSEVEHNRWNIEKLLLGYRGVYKDEQEEIEKSESKKKSPFKKNFIHYDIRSYSDLRPDESGRNANAYDVCLTESLPIIVKDSLD